MADPELESPAVIRHIAYLKDVGLSWNAIERELERKFSIITTQNTLKRIYSEYSLRRKELVESSPELKQRIQRDLLYAMERFDDIEKEVQGILDRIKRKELISDDDDKTLLMCVDRMTSLLEKRVDLLQKVEPHKKHLAGPGSTLNITQNIVNQLDELEKQGAITINRGSKANVIDTTAKEEPEDAERYTKEDGWGQDKDRVESGDDPERVRGDAGQHPQGEAADGAGAEAIRADAQPDARDQGNGGAPVVTASVTTPGVLRPKSKDSGEAQPDKINT